MNVKTLDKAMAEARRFLEIAIKVPIEEYYTGDKRDLRVVKNPSPESAACKRASMDLTRALSDMRKTRM